MMALIGFSASAVQALTYQNGDYMGSLNKKASGAQCFVMALSLYWDIVTGLPWTPNGVCFLEPRGYCIFLPDVHLLTLNSPYGADASLNKLLLLLLTMNRKGSELLNRKPPRQTAKILNTCILLYFKNSPSLPVSHCSSNCGRIPHLDRLFPRKMSTQSLSRSTFPTRKPTSSWACFSSHLLPSSPVFYQYCY